MLTLSLWLCYRADISSCSSTDPVRPFIEQWCGAGIWPAVNLIPNPCCSFSAFFPLLSDFSLLLGNSQCIVRVFLLFLIFYFIWLIAVLCRKSRLFKSAYWLNENENLLESEKTSLFCHGIGSRRTMDASNRTWTTVWISPQTCHQSNLSPESGEKKRIQ